MFFDTDPKSAFSTDEKTAVPILAITESGFNEGVAALEGSQKTWAAQNGFSGKQGQTCFIPDKEGHLSKVLFGLGESSDDATSFAHAALARSLPSGSYRLSDGLSDNPHAALAWAMGGYAFNRYRKPNSERPTLATTPDEQTARLVEAVYMARDLINTPANDMGPRALEDAFRRLADHHGGTVSVTTGDDLLRDNFPMVHAVGRASTQPPRVLDMVWGDNDAPKLTLVGKGVTFDTGGLNIKPGSSMSLMKKDMGGAANVMALAHLVMSAKLPVRLRLIVGAVENAIAGNAFRPGDILQTRNGMTVEIGNTDAEGRLVLGDCLTLADEESPNMLVDMATLTGAARVALGPDLAPFYTHDDAFADALSKAGESQHDPVWRMPLWAPYQSMLSSSVADVNHISTGGFAGSVTAALFLSRFVKHADTWAHFDIYGWVPKEKPWAPVGGEALAIRALFAVLAEKFKA